MPPPRGYGGPSPSLEKQPLDRHTFIAIKGQTARILSHPLTDQEVVLDWTEKDSRTLSGVPNINRSLAFRLAKKQLPQPVKDVIKKILVRLGLRKGSTIPDFRASLQAIAGAFF